MLKSGRRKHTSPSRPIFAVIIAVLLVAAIITVVLLCRPKVAGDSAIEDSSSTVVSSENSENSEPGQTASEDAASQPSSLPVASENQAASPSSVPTIQIEPGEWQLLLVNPWNKLPADYSVSLTQLKNSQSVDSRCYPALQQMMDDCRAAGNSPLICSSYRTNARQQALFDNKVSRLVAQGLSNGDAYIEAAKVVALPGTSEHQLGLAVDIVSAGNQNLDNSQENTPTQKWLMNNSWRYGFILRYPSDKSDITGIIYEPWHYRFVGAEAAEQIHSRGICLEEYLGKTSH